MGMAAPEHRVPRGAPPQSQRRPLRFHPWGRTSRGARHLSVRPRRGAPSPAPRPHMVCMSNNCSRFPVPGLHAEARPLLTLCPAPGERAPLAKPLPAAHSSALGHDRNQEAFLDPLQGGKVSILSFHKAWAERQGAGRGGGQGGCPWCQISLSVPFIRQTVSVPEPALPSGTAVKTMCHQRLKHCAEASGTLVLPSECESLEDQALPHPALPTSPSSLYPIHRLTLALHSPQHRPPVRSSPWSFYPRAFAHAVPSSRSPSPIFPSNI